MSRTREIAASLLLASGVIVLALSVGGAMGWIKDNCVDHPREFVPTRVVVAPTTFYVVDGSECSVAFSALVVPVARARVAFQDAYERCSLVAVSRYRVTVNGGVVGGRLFEMAGDAGWMDTAGMRTNGRTQL